MLRVMEMKRKFYERKRLGINVVGLSHFIKLASFDKYAIGERLSRERKDKNLIAQNQTNM